MRSASISNPQLEPDALGKPALGSVALHAGIFGSLALLSVLHIHGKGWGDRNDTQGAIQATMVSSAPSIPIPTEQTPTKEVLATETPSPAPALPAPQAFKADPQDAIPIPDKQAARIQPKRQVDQPKPQPVQHVPLISPTQARALQQQPQHRANFGEAAPAAIPRSTAQAAPAAQATVQGGNFGAMFPWYVDLIKRKTAGNWYKQEVDPGTANGARVYLTFTINRGGSPSNVQVERSSGSPTLDSSCVRAVQRTDTYGPLPSGYTGSTLLVQYYCEQSRL